ncbi:DUF2612 domain-containing protein [Brevibacillus reuszeri]|uniref:DUF2612 domain-containing protein n=1 Tax=Brevibacillus reuszeri TaxID=54915 RepID=UPI000CCC555B|nr:DUF2612 domain-containing protein [Brevibacillus reuszeri]
MAIQEYLDPITSQHWDKEKFMRWLTAMLEKEDAAVTVANYIPIAFSVDQAVGVQLNTLGDLVGRSRYLPFQLADGSSPVLDDSNYRIALKAKIAQNQWEGTLPQIYELWADLFPNARLKLKDNQNMSMKATIRGELGLQSVLLVTVGYIIPKPAGVSLTISWESELDRKDYIGMNVTTRDTVEISCAGPA